MPSSALLNKRLKKKILDLRKQIDLLDDEFCKILKKRKRIVDRVQRIKRKAGVPYRDLPREIDIIRRLVLKNPSLDPTLLRYIYKALFSSAHR